MKLYYIEITVENGIDYECCNVFKTSVTKNRVLFESESWCPYYATNINVINKSSHGLGFYVFCYGKK